MKESTRREPELSRQGSDERSELDTQDRDVEATGTSSARWKVGVGLAAHGLRHLEEGSGPGSLEGQRVTQRWPPSYFHFPRFTTAHSVTGTGFMVNNSI